MEVSGTVIRQSVSLMRESREIQSISDKIRVRVRVWQRVAPWSDDVHRLYYASPLNCSVYRDAKRKEKKKKKRDDLLTELSQNLIRGEEIVSEARENMIKEAAELLLAQLNQQKAKEKEMKKRKKEEKKAMKVAKMRNYAEMSSSSSSSESSDTDCEDIVVMNKTRKNLMEEVKPNLLNVPDQFSVCNGQAQSPPAVEEDEKAEQNHTNKLKIETDLIKCVNNTAVSIWSDNMLAVGKLSNKIEVCMGGKCKKSGAIGLLQEFEKKIGVEGVVVACKCMGKCKDGPNVRIVNGCSSKGELADVVSESKKPLCIAVGLEDVSTIVANFFSENNTDMNLVGA
nr:diacylglycerol acyltransferase 3 [Erycina pusilla]